MNNTKLTRTAKNLDILANVAGKITAAVGIICIVVAFLTLIFGGKMFAEGSLTLDLDFMIFHLRDHTYVNEQFMKFYVCAATLGGGILCFLICYISKLCRKILSPMKDGRPFEDGVFHSLRKIGWVTLIGGTLSELVGIVARMLLVKAYSLTELFISPAISETEFVFSMNFDFVLIVCVIFFLSYIFAYGQVLQQESDETL